MDRRSTRLSVGTVAVVAALVSCATFASPAGAAPTATPHVGAIVGTVTGTVPSGSPVPVGGVRVTAATVDAVSGGVNLTAVTTATGSYRFTDLPVWKTYSVCFTALPAAQTASAVGFVSHCHGTTTPYPLDDVGTPVPVAANRTTRVDDVLPAAAAVRGTVVDTAGRPVAGVPVRADDDIDGADAVTDANGVYVARGLLSDRATVCAEPSRLPVTATDPGAARTCVDTTTTLGATTTVDVALAAGGGVSGRLVDGNGNAVVGAAVAFSDSAATPVTFTNGAGRWSVAHLTPGAVRVCFTPPADANLLAACTPGTVAVRAGRYTAVARPLPTAAAVTGTVTDTSGNPLRNVAVSVVAFDGAPETQVVTGYDGRFRVVGITPGSGRVCFDPRQDVAGGLSDNGYVARCRFLTFTPGTNTAGAALAASSTVAGRVTDETGRGVGGAAIRLTSPPIEGKTPVVLTTTTSTDGRYLLRDVPRGSYEVEVSHLEPGFGAPAGWTVPADGTNLRGVEVGARGVTGFDLHLLRSAGFDVVVTGPSQEPLGQVEVRVDVTGQGGYVQLTTDRDGRVQSTDQAARARICALAVDPRPGYPTGLAERCTTATFRAGVVTRLGLTLAEAGA